ncbi:MAG TPA: chloride channel protein [Ktedonobacterales bacterium]
MLRDSSLTGATESAAFSLRWKDEEVRRLALFSVLGAGMGIVGAVAAWVLYHLIMIITGLAFFHTFSTHVPIYPPAHSIGAWVVIIPVGGGLLVGLMAKYGTDRIRGHGIPEAMEAVLKFKARVSPRIAIFKPISAAIAVGTGGPFGAEGPIIQTGGAIGSLLGQTMNMTAAERRTLLACGGAAGMVGIFNTPIAAVALALELLLFEFRARSLVPVILASAVAAALRPVLLGGHAMFALGKVPSLGGPLDLLWFVPLGIIIGVCAVVISKALYVVEEFFDRLPISLIFKPALGALVLGIVALFQPLVLGMGYTTITEVLQNHFTNGTLAGLAVGKSVALVASLGAGTSGGLLAPMLLIGAAMGTTFGRGIHTLFPAAGISPGICGIVAMSSLFSAAARAPLTSFIFAFELTGDYNAVVPLMIGCMVSDIVARALSSESVMTERLVRRGLRVDQGYEPSMLSLISVGEVMTRTLDTIAAHLPLRVALKGLLGEPVALSLYDVYALPAPGVSVAAAGGSVHPQATGATIVKHKPVGDGRARGNGAKPGLDGGGGAGGGVAEDGEVCSIGLHQRWTFPVVDADGQLVGIVTRGELLGAAGNAEALNQPVLDFATKQVAVAYVDESLDAALMRMLAADVALLPVVDRQEPAKLLGVLSRGDVLRARLVREADETQRERLLLVRRHPALAPDEARELVGVGAATEQTQTEAAELETATSPLTERGAGEHETGALPTAEQVSLDITTAQEEERT